MLKLLLISIFLAPWCVLGQMTADRVNLTGRGRYTAAEGFRFEQVDFPQPDYKFESVLPEGFGRATAAELGVAGWHFWNEYPGQGAALVTMAPETVLIYDTVSRQPLYVTGCHRDGRPDGLNRLKGMNRIKAVPSAPAPAASAPAPDVVALTFTAEPAVELDDLPPAPAPPAPPAPIQFEPDKGRKFPIPCFPRERTKFGIIMPLAECAGIGLGIGLPLSGGAAVGTKFVPVWGVISPF